jgi:hypothetical protein
VRAGEPLFGLVNNIHKALTTARPRTRYVVDPNRLLSGLVNSIPKRMADRLIARRVGLMPT